MGGGEKKIQVSHTNKSCLKYIVEHSRMMIEREREREREKNYVITIVLERFTRLRYACVRPKRHRDAYTPGPGRARGWRQKTPFRPACLLRPANSVGLDAAIGSAFDGTAFPCAFQSSVGRPSRHSAVRRDRVASVRFVFASVPEENVDGKSVPRPLVDRIAVCMSCFFSLSRWPAFVALGYCRHLWKIRRVIGSQRAFSYGVGYVVDCCKSRRRVCSLVPSLQRFDQREYARPVVSYVPRVRPCRLGGSPRMVEYDTSKQRAKSIAYGPPSHQCYEPYGSVGNTKFSNFPYRSFVHMSIGQDLRNNTTNLICIRSVRVVAPIR